MVRADGVRLGGAVTLCFLRDGLSVGPGPGEGLFRLQRWIMRWPMAAEIRGMPGIIDVEGRSPSRSMTARVSLPLSWT